MPDLDNKRAEVRFISVRHDIMHVLIALFELVSDIIDEDPDPARWQRNAIMLSAAVTMLKEGEWEKFVTTVHAHHAAVCGVIDDKPEVPQDRRVVRLDVMRKRMILLLMYDSFSAASLAKDLNAVRRTLGQLQDIMEDPDMIREAMALQRELHLTAQATWPEDLGLKLF